MSARYYRHCDFCGREVDCSPDYPEGARVACADCMLSMTDEMAETYVSGHCWVCNVSFRFHPDLVPRAIGVPLCAPCITRINELLEADNRRPIPVPLGAYPDDEGTDPI